MKVKSYLIIVIFFSSIFISAQDLKDLKDNDLLPVDPKVKMGKLDNGITYYIRENKKPEHRAELRLVVNAGSILEDNDQLGLAHFVEHMGFNGTKNFKKQELIDFLETIGMHFGPEINAFTSFDETVYMLQLPTDTIEYFEKGFEVLGEWAHNVSFEDNEIDKERGVIIEEWRLGRGADMRMFDKQLPILFKDSRYADRITIGKKEILENFNYDTLKRFYRDWYRPDLIAVVAVGDFDKSKAEEFIKKYFSEIKPPAHERERQLFPVPDHKETLYAIASDKEATYSSVSLYIKSEVKEERTLKDYKRALVENLFSSILSFRLYELTKLPDPPFVGAYAGISNLIRTKGVSYLAAQVKDNGIPKGLEAIIREAERVRLHGFTSTELERQKKEMLRNIENEYNERDKTNSDNIIWDYVNNFLSGDQITGIENEYELQKEILPEITLEQVNAIAAQLLGKENRVVMVDCPEKEGVKIPTEAELNEVMEKVVQENITAYSDLVSSEDIVPVEPTPAKIINEKIDNKIAVTELELANGVKVILKPTDFKNDQLLMTAFSPGGTSLVPDNKYLSAAIATSIIRESGLGNFSQVDLMKYLSGKIVNANNYISELFEGFSGTASPVDIETLFKLIYAEFTSPRLDSSAYKSYIARMKTFLENKDLDPESAYQDTIQVTVTNYHPRTKPWTKQLLDSINLNDAFRVYKDRFADASDFTFIFVGNFEIDKIKPLIEKYLGGLPSLKRKEHWKDVGINAPSGIIKKVVRRGVEPKSQVFISFNGKMDWSIKESYYLSSMAEAMDIKLREVIREEQSGTYGISINADAEHYPVPKYNIEINFGCDPARVEELTKSVMVQIDSIKNFGIKDIYLTKIKEQQLRARETNLKTNGFWLNALRSAYQNGYDPDGILEYTKMVNELTKADIQDTVKKYFDENNYIQIVLLPEDKK